MRKSLLLAFMESTLRQVFGIDMEAASAEFESKTPNTIKFLIFILYIFPTSDNHRV